ncbi:transketolase C-terminal domain-containing protein, partial [Streptomyces griseus]
MNEFLARGGRVVGSPSYRPTTRTRAVRAADLLDAQGISSTVVDPRWVKPVDEA